MDNELSSLTIIFTEFYYWVTVVFMFLIHVGFCVYEVGCIATQKPSPHAHDKHLDCAACHCDILLFWLVDLFRFSEWSRCNRWSDCRAVGGALEASSWVPTWAARPRATRSARQIQFTGRVSTAFSGRRFYFSHGPLLQSVSGACIERIRSGAVLDPRSAHRFGAMDYRCRLGLASGWLDGAETRLPRCLRLGRHPRHRRRVCARRTDRARATDWQVSRRRQCAHYPAGQPVVCHDRIVPDFYRLLGFLRGPVTFRSLISSQATAYFSRRPTSISDRPVCRQLRSIF